MGEIGNKISAVVGGEVLRVGEVKYWGSEALVNMIGKWVTLQNMIPQTKECGDFDWIGNLLHGALILDGDAISLKSSQCKDDE